MRDKIERKIVIKEYTPKVRELRRKTNMNNSGGDPRKLTHKQEMAVYLLEWFPELLLLLTDILILASSGHADKVAGASVASIIMGAIARIVRAPSSTTAKLAEKNIFMRKELLSINYYWAGGSVVLLSLVWIASGIIEEFVRLPGMTDYILYAAPASVVIRISTVGYIALGVNQARVKGRIFLAWFMALTNVGLTYLLVNVYGMGVSGASLGTLLAEVVPLICVLSWAHKDGLISKPSTRLLPFVWENASKKTWSELPAMLGSVAAVLLNRWMGEELSRQWTYAQTCADVVGGFLICVLGVTSKHFTYNLQDVVKRGKTWACGDKVALYVVGVGTVLSALVSPMGPLVVVAYCMAKRNAFKCDRWADKRGFDAQANGKLAYVATCVVGYGILVLFVQPSVWAAVAVYCCGQTAHYFAATR